jgi:putative DNA primase/helicase
VDFTAGGGETLETHAPNFWRWLDRAVAKSAKTRCDSGRAVYGAGEPLRLAALSRSDRAGGSGKSILAEIATMLAGEDNATSATIDTLEDPAKRAADWLLAHPSA